MKVRYPGHMKGYHVVGRRGVALVPGVNEVDDAVAEELLARDLVLALPDEAPDVQDEDENGRDERDD